MKTALFIILITESVLKEISTMGIPNNATETIPENMFDGERISTYATEMTVNGTNDSEKGLSTYATEKISNVTNANENQLSSNGMKTLLQETIDSERGILIVTEKISNVMNADEKQFSTDAMKTIHQETIDNGRGIPIDTEKISIVTNASVNKLSMDGNILKPLKTITKEIIIDNEMGISSAPKKLRKGMLEKKKTILTKAAKQIMKVKVGRNKGKVRQAKLTKKAISKQGISTEDDTDSYQVSLDSVEESTNLKSKLKKKKFNITNPEKASLRYGFQQTKQCQDYEKAFMCIRKCLDMGYDIANADRKCVCTCRRNRMIHMHKQLIKLHSSTPWKGGAPTTSLPPWVIKQSSGLPILLKNPENDDYEVYADMSFSHKSGEGTIAGSDANEDEKATGGSGEEKGDGEDDGEANGEEEENATSEGGEGGEEGGGEGVEGGEGGEGGEGEEGGDGSDAAPTEDGEAATEPEKEAPADR